MTHDTEKSLLLYRYGDKTEILIDTNNRSDPHVQARMMEMMKINPGVTHRFVSITEMREARAKNQLTLAET